MTDIRLATVGDVIAALSTYDPTSPLRIATQPNYPMEHHLARVAYTPEGDGTVRTDPPVVWLGIGEQGRVPSLACRRRPRVVAMTTITTFTVLAELSSAGEAGGARRPGQRPVS